MICLHLEHKRWFLKNIYFGVCFMLFCRKDANWSWKVMISRDFCASITSKEMSCFNVTQGQWSMMRRLRRMKKNQGRLRRMKKEEERWRKEAKCRFTEEPPRPMLQYKWSTTAIRHNSKHEILDHRDGCQRRNRAPRRWRGNQNM